MQEAVTLQAARSAGKQAVYGQNRQLEKEYLRLTSMPTLDAVRPPAVLKKALQHVQQRWLQVKSVTTMLTENHRVGCHAKRFQTSSTSVCQTAPAVHCKMALWHRWV